MKPQNARRDSRRKTRRASVAAMVFLLSTSRRLVRSRPALSCSAKTPEPGPLHDAGLKRELRRAIELNPNLAMAHQYYGWYLSSQGRLEDALAEHKVALGFDPTSLIGNMSLCGMYYSAREYDKSIQQCLGVVQMYPDNSIPHYQLSQDYEQKKLYDKAVQEYQQGLRVQGETELAAAMGRAYAANGWRGVLQKGIDVYQKRGTNDYDPT